MHGVFGKDGCWRWTMMSERIDWLSGVLVEELTGGPFAPPRAINLLLEDSSISSCRSCENPRATHSQLEGAGQGRLNRPTVHVERRLIGCQRWCAV